MRQKKLPFQKRFLFYKIYFVIFFRETSCALSFCWNESAQEVSRKNITKNRTKNNFEKEGFSAPPFITNFYKKNFRNLEKNYQKTSVKFLLTLERVELKRKAPPALGTPTPRNFRCPTCPKKPLLENDICKVCGYKRK